MEEASTAMRVGVGWGGGWFKTHEHASAGSEGCGNEVVVVVVVVGGWVGR